MGHKRKNNDSSSFSSRPPTAASYSSTSSSLETPVANATEISATVNDAASPLTPEVKAAVNAEVEKSHKEFHLGNFRKAKELMINAIQMHKSYPLPQFLLSRMSVLIARSAKDPAVKLSIFAEAIFFAAKACFLSPFNVRFHSHEASIHYEVAKFSMDSVSYDEAIKKCNLALKLPTKKLIDPAKDFANGNRILHLRNFESRIEYYLQLLQYIQHNAICSKERLRDIMSVQSKVPKTQDEVMGNIRSSSFSKMRLQGNCSQRQSKQTFVTGQIKIKALEYLKSLSIEDRLNLNLYSVSVQDLREAAKRLKLDALSSEAISVSAVGHPNQAFPCCYCQVDPFATADAHLFHIKEKHVVSPMDCILKVYGGNLIDRLLPLLPENASSSLIESFVTSDWSPLDNPLGITCQSTDPERAEILCKIVRMFKVLEEQKILSVRQVDFVIELAQRCIFRGSYEEQRNDGLYSIGWIRFLLTPHLMLILEFLKKLELCGAGKDKEENSADANVVQGMQATPWRFLNQNSIFLDLDQENPEALIDWLYQDSTGDDDYRLAWSRTLNESRELIEKYQIEFIFWFLLCKEKLRFLDASNNLGNLMLLDNVGLEQLKKRQEELVSNGSNMVELVAIIEIIQSADQGIDDVYTLISMKALVLYIQVCKIDATILSTQRTQDQLVQKIEQASVYDYQMALLQHAKSFLQMRLEDLLTEKADALMKELIAEEIEGLQINEDRDHSKQGKGKPKVKRNK